MIRRYAPLTSKFFNASHFTPTLVKLVRSCHELFLSRSSSSKNTFTLLSSDFPSPMLLHVWKSFMVGLPSCPKTKREFVQQTIRMKSGNTLTWRGYFQNKKFLFAL